MSMYKMIGGDGKEYGPVPAEQLRQWMAEGRVNNQTNIRADGTTDWKPLATLPEFSTCPQSPPLISPPSLPTPPNHPTMSSINSMAIIGLVIGILSLPQCCSFLFGTLGIIFSCIAISQINAHPTEQTGKGIAVAGLVTSIVGIAISVVLLIIYWSAILAAFASHR